MTEHAEQTIVFQWARMSAGRYPELAFMFAIPNGAKLPYMKNSNGQRYSPQAIKLLDEGLLPGVSDIFLCAARGGWHGLFIELKHGTNTLSDKQQAFAEAMLSFGYLAVACWEADQAIVTIENYLEGRLTR